PRAGGRGRGRARRRRRPERGVLGLRPRDPRMEDVEASGQGEGYNVVAHEFAHKLDLLDGAVNGMPPLHRDMSAAAWTDVFQAAYDDLVEQIERGEEPWIDPYAAENPGEFFAVCTELFFD